MNKIFKVVWSKAKQCYVVVSEVANNHSGKKKIVVASVLAALAVGSEMAVVNVQAAITEGTVSGGAAVAIGPNTTATNSHATAVGKEVQAGGAYSQAIGFQAKTTAQNGVAIGSSGVSGTWTTAGANDAVAIGTAARALSTNGVAIGRFSKVDGSNHSVALGTGSEATAADSTNTTSYLTSESVNNSGNGVIAVGNKHTASDTGTITRRIVGVAGGSEDYDAVNLKQLKALETATATNMTALEARTHTRFLAVSGAANKTETDFPDETWTLTPAVPASGTSTGTAATTLTLKGNFNNEAAVGERAVAVGPWANGIGARSVALGGRAVSNGMQAISVGQASFAYGENAMAMGSYASVNGENSLAIGTDTFVGKATRGATNKGVSEVGDKTTFGVAIGFNAKTYGNASVSLGKQAQADSLHSVVLGESSLSKAEDNTNTTAYLTNDAVNNAGNGVVSIGNADSNVTRRIINVAGGTNDTDAVNVKQLKALETKSVQKFLSINGALNRTKTNYPDKTWTIGSPAVTAADGSVTTAATTSNINIMGNYDNEGARGDNSVALGPWANGIGPRSVALGSNAIANGNQSIALGQSTFGHGENTLALGSYATVNGENSIAIGTDTYVGKAERNGSGKGISSTGNKTTAAIAIGFGAKAYGNASTVLGLAAQSDLAHSVVLGEGSKAVEDDGTNGTSYLTGDAVSNSGNGVVSIGNTTGGKNITRRIINVAGGTNDLDAVNVKQLKALENISLQTLTVNNGGTKTDLTPQARKLTLTAGDNVTLTPNAATGEVTISATGSVNAINSGNADTLSVNNNNGTVTITPNTTSNLSNTADANKLVTAGTVKSALDQKANVSDLVAKANASDVTALTNKVTAAEGVANTAKSTADTAKTTAEAAKTAAAEAKAGLAAKIDTTAERHVKEGSYAVQTDGTVTLTKVDGAGTEKANEEVKITGLATKASVDTLTTKVGTVEGVANQAKATADTALTKATEAKNTAEAAKAGLADKADKSTVTDLTTKVGTVETTANAAKAGLADKADKSTVTDLTTKVGTVEATANAAKTGLADKADKATVTDLTTKVGIVEATANAAQEGLADKADKSTVTDLTTKVGTVEATANAAKAGLADKADKSTVTDLTTKVGTVEATANAAKAGLADKADKSTVTDLTTKVGTVEATANAAKAGLADKADKATVDALTTEVGKKANAEEVNAELAKKANAEQVNAELAKKVNAADLQNLTSNKVEKTAERHVKQGTYTVGEDGSVTLTKVDGEGTEKADEAVVINGLATKASVDALTTKVGEVESAANAAKAGLADKADKSTVTDLTTKVGTVEATANAAKAGLADKADKATVEALTTEVGKKANASDVQNLTTNKLDKTAERHVKEGTYTVAADGSVTLTKVDGEGTEKADEAVVINGFATKVSVDTLTTEVGKKADAATVTAELAKKADQTAVDALTTEVDKKANAEEVNAELAKKANADQVNAELAKKVNAADLQNLTSNKVEKTAERHVKQGMYTVGEDGSVTLTKVDGEGTEKADEAVVINGLATKASVDTLTTKVGEVENTANTAKTAAGEAKAKAEEANTTAGEAKALAGEAKTTAGEAKTAADQANTAAGEAKALAGEAKTIAGEAKTVADQANATAGEAKTLATEAKTTAGEAKAAADQANTTAGEAKTTAGEAKATAEQANTTAGEAKALATEAKTTAGEAKTAAEQANATAGEAKQTAETVKTAVDAVKASLGDLSSDGRDGANGESANKGLTAQDGLNGKTLAEKVNALRNGEAGTLVYTDKDGHRLVKAKDGNYYRAEAVLSDGTVKPEVELPEGIKPEKVEKPELRIVSPDGTTTPAKLSNVENGAIAENSKDAVNGGQLFAANKNVASIIGTTLDANGQLVAPTFNVKDKDNKNATSVVQAINLMNEKLDSSNKDLADLSDAGKKVITDLVNVTGDNNITVTPSVDEKTKAKTFTAKLNDTITLGKGDNAVSINGTNGTVTAKNVKANDGVFGAPADANGVPTATGNTTTINKDGVSVVSKDEAGNVSKVEIKNGKISGVTPGKEDDDVATVGQVNDAIAQTANNIGKALEKTSNRVNQVGAHAAALAAMNPLSYDPLRKSQIMAGIGTYSGNQALALGVAHYANENFMFNVGVTMGEGKSMANVGATYRFGTGDDDTIPERYKGGPISSVYVMQDEISALKAENARKDVEYGNKIDMLMERIAMLEAKLK